VLCEKPLAGTKKECKHIVKACRKFGVKLMTAYRLHFEHANLEAAEMIHSGKIGEPRIFNSTFSQQVRPGNMRVKPRNEGGPLHDIGIYCINAARYLFRAEPTQGVSFSASGKDPRFRKVDEMNSIILRFPEERLASFTVSFGATDTANYEVIGTKGKLRAVHGYEYSTPITLELTADGRTHTKKYPLRDQFAPELIYFSDCIQKGREPEPSGEEGLRDVRIIQSLHKSAKRGVPVRLQPLKDHHYPDLKQDLYRPKVDKRRLVHVSSPST
jgi:glucose-fructose oxidoreductase